MNTKSPFLEVLCGVHNHKTVIIVGYRIGVSQSTGAVEYTDYISAEG